MKQMIRKKLLLSIYGLFWFQRFKRRHKIAPDTVVILCPNNNGRCTEFAVKYLDSFLKKTHNRNAVFLVEHKHHYKVVQEKNIVKVISVSKKKMAAFIQLYAVCYFYWNMVIASIYHPDVRAGERMVLAGENTEEELFFHGIYNIEKAGGQFDA